MPRCARYARICHYHELVLRPTDCFKANAGQDGHGKTGFKSLGAQTGVRLAALCPNVTSSP